MLRSCNANYFVPRTPCGDRFLLREEPWRELERAWRSRTEFAARLRTLQKERVAQSSFYRLYVLITDMEVTFNRNNRTINRRTANAKDGKAVSKAARMIHKPAAIDLQRRWKPHKSYWNLWPSAKRGAARNAAYSRGHLWASKYVPSASVKFEQINSFVRRYTHGPV